MCAIVGALLHGLNKPGNRDKARAILNTLWNASHSRGRDGRGYLFRDGDSQVWGERSTRNDALDISPADRLGTSDSLVLIGNVRAEPTTEYIKNKETTDQQPYTLGPWSIVHNGTIANDKDIRTFDHPTKIDSAAIVELLERSPPHFSSFLDAVLSLNGSYAILARHSRTQSLFVAANYRPIWYIETDFGYFFGSSRECFPNHACRMLEPYTAAEFKVGGMWFSQSLRAVRTPGRGKRRALVVCSGGLDSVVSAAALQKEGYDIHLIHFQYGSRAEGPEIDAVKKVAQALGCGATLFPMPVYKPGDSPLLNPNATVAGGEEGAEFAHEWVPARNLVMLSIAVAVAEAQGVETVALGNNLEEAGAYPDNEPEFIHKLNDVLPFAVGAGKRVEIVMPVGNLMKHEIVALGARIGAPMHLTWSCYRAGCQHCGTCGPCYMRRTAFKINGLKDPLNYEN